MPRRQCWVRPPRSAFAGFRFPPDVIMVAIRWYLRYGLSYRDVEELLAERGIAVDQGRRSGEYRCAVMSRATGVSNRSDGGRRS
jgi:hypothetical protein